MTRWFPIAPGATLPPAPAAVGGELTVTKTVPVWNETVMLSARTRTQLVVNAYDYSLSQLSSPNSLVSQTLLDVVKLTIIKPAAASLSLAAAAPKVSISAAIAIPTTSIATDPAIPAVSGGASAAPPNISVTFNALTPQSAGPQQTLIKPPALDISLFASTPQISKGAMVAVGVSNTALSPLVPSQTGTESDPYFSSVSLLLHADGANGSTTISDSSANGISMTVYGNAQISTTNPKFGTGSLLLDGSGDYLKSAANSAMAFGTGDFTIECWCYPEVAGNYDGLFKVGDATAGPGLAFYGGYWYIIIDTVLQNQQGTVTTGAWQHVALTRSGSNLRLFINGTQSGSTQSAGSYNYTSNQVLVGYNNHVTNVFQGKIDEFRVTKGVARYTSNFTAPTAPFPNK